LPEKIVESDMEISDGAPDVLGNSHAERNGSSDEGRMRSPLPALRLATRKSPMAMAQSQLVADA
jgi:hypothetical protein